MTDQLQVAKEWLADLNVILSKQKTKGDYVYGKKRSDALEWLVNRVEELEKDTAEWEIEARTQYVINKRIKKENNCYKQALVEIAKARAGGIGHFISVTEKILDESLEWSESE